MPEQNSDKHDIKLFFDVVPASTDGNEVKDLPAAKSNLTPPPPPPVDRKEEAPIQPPSPGSKSSGMQKWLFIAVGIVILILAGYFGYKYFPRSGQQNSPTSAITTTPVTSGFDTVWLKKYFGIDKCQDQNLCGPDADPDKDGLINTQEQKYNTDPLNPDTDHDGIADGDEINVYHTDPIVADTDGDGFEDGVETRNGYSPTVKDDKLAPLEKQQIDDNIKKFGLHALTSVFMDMTNFKTLFEPGSTTTPQLALSVPKDWVFSSSAGIKTFKRPDGDGFIIVQLNGVNPAAENDLQLYWSAVTNFTSANNGKDLGQKNVEINRIAFHIDEYQTFIPGTSTPSLHGSRVVFLKNGRLFDVVFAVPDGDWDKFKDSATAVINSIR